jgi:hypothetical protein
MYPTSPEKYELYEKIGEGSFSEVYRESIINKYKENKNKYINYSKFLMKEDINLSDVYIDVYIDVSKTT